MPRLVSGSACSNGATGVMNVAWLLPNSVKALSSVPAELAEVTAASELKNPKAAEPVVLVRRVPVLSTTADESNPWLLLTM